MYLSLTQRNQLFAAFEFQIALQMLLVSHTVTSSK